MAYITISHLAQIDYKLMRSKDMLNMPMRKHLLFKIETSITLYKFLQGKKVQQLLIVRLYHLIKELFSCI